MALLFGLFWQRSSTPQLELTAALKPIAPKMLVAADGNTTTGEGLALAEKTALVDWTTLASARTESPAVQAVNVAEAPRHATERRPATRRELSLLATMTQTVTPWAVTPNQALTDPQDVLMETTLADEALAWTPEGMIRDEEAELLAQQGFVEKTEVELVEFGEMLRRGWRSVKVEIAQLNESVTDSFRLHGHTDRQQ